MGKIVPLSANIDHQYENDNTPIMNRTQSSGVTSSGRPAARALRSAPIPALPPTSPVHPGFQQQQGGGGGSRQGGGGQGARRYNTTHHGHRNGGGGGRHQQQQHHHQQQQQQQQQYPPSPSYHPNGSYSAYPASPSSPSFSNYPSTPSSPLPAYQELNMYVERPSPVAQPPQYSARNMVYNNGHGNGSQTNLNNYYGQQQQHQQQQYHYHNDSNNGRSDPRHQPPYRSNSGGDVGGGGGGSGYPKRTGLPTGNNSGAYYPMTRTGTQRQRSMQHDDGGVGESWLCCKERVDDFKTSF
ncbi:hypothetical protein DFQ26_003310 [Actinomortierella ambigua]|nr:hypothetical protein DFQ26_003310 [Actinomortierella ambigua]